MKNPSSSPRFRVSPGKVGPHDLRYGTLLRRAFSKRFAGKPDFVRLVGSTDQVVAAVQHAVRDKLRIVVRRGHRLEGFVPDPAVRVVIDTSLMKAVYYDPAMAAFAIEPGATVGEVHRKLFMGWGVTIPAGESPHVGIGGHVMGGAFGFLCREHGLAADHLYGVEVVVTDAKGMAKSVVATREPSDPNRELWWAHTGGGGGNFGIVTRYWFRSPDATGTDPARLLPRAPQSVVSFRAEWSWKDVDESAFSKLVRNYGAWCERNSEAESPYAKLFSALSLGRRQRGTIEVRGVLTAGADAQRLLDEHLAAINDGVGVRYTRQVVRNNWLEFALAPFSDLFATRPSGVGAQKPSFKLKDAFLRKRHTDRQIGVAYDYLTRDDHDVAGGMLGLATHGGKVNTVAPDATAAAQRESTITTSYSVGWEKPQDEAPSLTWLRRFYRDVFADTGGVPVPGDLCNGALINHPDVDFADPEWNTSGVPWHQLYYKGNYPRLQRVKAQWDPRNVFQHALSIRR
jgi:FAD/FMN-containing dehydrogenase